MFHRQTLEQLLPFSQPGQFEIHEHQGLAYFEVTNRRCRARFYLLGAHVTEFQPQSEANPLLFMSRSAVFREGRPIRGGIPICFPWFSSNEVDPKAPAHGLVRQKLWELKDVKIGSDETEVLLSTNTDHFDVTYRLVFADQLTAELTVRNTTESTQRYEAALHSYFRISDIRHVKVHGLENTTYFDQLTGETKPPSGDVLRFVAETDRIYRETEDAIEIEDPGFRRTIRVEKSGSRSTVVWNPWHGKAQRMEDFGDHEWPLMCCIESANIDPESVYLEPNERHTMTAIHSVS